MPWPEMDCSAKEEQDCALDNSNILCWCFYRHFQPSCVTCAFVCQKSSSWRVSWEKYTTSSMDWKFYIW